MEEKRKTAQRLPAVVVALGVTSLFTDMGSDMIFPLLPVFLTSLGASPAFLGLVEGLADATASLIKLISGHLADRVASKKPLIIGGYSAAALARPLMALATAPWHVLAIRLTDRVGKGLRAAPRDALIAASVDRNQAGRAFGFHRAMDHAGAVIGPLIASALVALGWPLRSVFLLALIPGALSVLTLLTVREPEAPRAPAAGSAHGTRPPLPRRLLSYLLLLTVFSLGNSSDAFLLLRAHQLGVATAALPLLWTALHATKVTSSYVAGSWSDRIPRHRLIASGWLVYAITYLGLGVATARWQAWALFLLYGAYFGLAEPAEKALVKDLAPTNTHGRAYGLYNFVIGACSLPAGLMTGWVWQTWSARAALTVGAAFAVAASLGLSLWGETGASRNNRASAA